MACSNRRCFGCEKGLVFSSCKATRKRKAFSQHSKTSTFHHTQTNVQLQISSAKNHCELAAKQPFFETSQSCVSIKGTLSHRFKSSPSIPGKVALSDAAGYIMMAGHFRENHVSSGDLNRSPESRGLQTSGVLLVLFVQAKRINPYSLAGSSEVLRTSNQPTQTRTSH